MKASRAVALGLFGALALGALLPRFETAQPRGLSVTRPAAVAIATAEARRLGIPVDEAFRVVSLAAASLGAARTAERAIRETTTLALMGPLADAKAQLAGLVHPGFVARTGAAQLPRLPVPAEPLRILTIPNQAPVGAGDPAFAQTANRRLHALALRVGFLVRTDHHQQAVH